MEGTILVRNTNTKSIKEIIKEAFHTFLELGRTEGANFIIKPNLGFKTDTKGGTTSVEIIEATLEVIRNEYKPRNIYLVESDGLTFRCEDVFTYLNLDKVCLKYGVKFINLCKVPTVKLENNNYNVLSSFDMPNIFMEGNTRLINLAKVKTHEVTRFSGAIKNLFGLNPYVFKVKYHPVMSLVLQDLYNIFKPDLTIVDGLWAVNGHGPWTGKPVNLNLIIAGNDALLVDLKCLKVFGWKVEEVPYLQRIIDTQGRIDYAVDGDSYYPLRFQWQPMSRFGKVKERIAKMLIPFFEKGMPFLYYSHGSFKLVLYGEKGLYCKSIKVIPKQKS